MKTYKIAFFGIVQGVGFRPFIYNFARTHGICGYVQNTGSNVIAIFQAKSLNLKSILSEIRENAPPSARISDISSEILTQNKIYKNFIIKQSQKSAHMLDSAIPRDLAICAICAQEMNAPTNFRFKYPFINCTNCGPRYSIIKKLPYDRKNTAMSDFKMCEICAREYSDMNNRRFHAQPNSCPKCGISLQIFDKFGKTLNLKSNQNGREISNLNSNLEHIQAAQKIIMDGKILALKGVGGFNLVCRAKSNIISRLRALKNRPTKPFAIAFGDISDAKKYFKISKIEARELLSSNAPIVLLKKSSLKLHLSAQIAPNLSTIGVIIAYSPLHKLFFEGIKEPLIFTSANLSQEPLARTKEEMFENVIFDFLLDFNRDIINPIDDSLVAILSNNQSVLLRAARGFYPLHLRVKIAHNNFKNEVILALGAHQKSQFALFYQNSIIISPYIGDLDNIKSIARFRATLELFLGLYDAAPSVILCDMHAQYFTSKIARELSLRFKARVYGVFHHRAHFYSCALECQTAPREFNLAPDSKILGVIFDGTGFGDDGAIWGGEFFLARGFNAGKIPGKIHSPRAQMRRFNQVFRLAHFKYFPLLGGDNAIKDIKKVALGVLFSVYGKEIPRQIQNKFENIEIFYSMFEKRINSPFSSSVGRLFDCVAYLCGALKNQSYEGESGLVLEALYNPKITRFYPFKIQDNEIILDSMIKGILRDLAQDSDILRAQRRIASKFINTLAHIILHFALRERAFVIFSGGVFQNRILCDKIIRLFRAHKVKFRMHERPNDGGIAFGQIGAFMHGDAHLKGEG